MREVLAPGKLVLLGEYAVLDGGPALVLAINRGVRCEVLPGQGIETPDGDDRFVRPALDGAPRALYRFSAWNPVDLPGKPGFGGSAAACVAACIAAGRPGSDAFAIHRAVQGGGSGLDVAASLAGGLICFQDGSVVGQRQPVIPTVVWSGTSARTGPRVASYRAWVGREAFVRASEELVALFDEDPLAAFREAGALLASMARQAGLDYLTPALARIRDLAADVGGAAKASGAGGGDCAVALFPDADAEAAFVEACAAEGFLRIPVAVAGRAGVCSPEVMLE